MDDVIPLSEEVFYNPAHSSLEMLSGTGNIHLTPNEKKLLEIVLENRGRKETIIDEIWTQQGIVVSESSYHQLVKMLRRKFQEADLPPSALKTIPRYGIVLVSCRKESGEPLHNDNVLQGAALVAEEAAGEWQESSVLPTEVPQADELSVHQPVSWIMALTSRCPVWLFAIVALLMIFAPAAWVYLQNDDTLFCRQLIKNNVTYHATSSTYFGKDMMARIAGEQDSAVKDIYISGNGPKIWVAYCRNTIDKENARCAYTHFSAY
ncbi:winged helix-turn-helix domain-containing protein [Serratia proteamaculans]|uniref:OmpR/PhoB-type domain-containing protein n=1 Tax=Serratia proteamaculans TaxID=28151 RepID=A0A5Q2VD19_SERPR|nr:helix-turn-helix domain-containing protein [Serratia proteamaculans]QGH61990.1 hypothetical protein GHV41_14665 [Serratia proteamaculans]